MIHFKMYQKYYVKKNNEMSPRNVMHIFVDGVNHDENFFFKPNENKRRCSIVPIALGKSGI